MNIIRKILKHRILMPLLFIFICTAFIIFFLMIAFLPKSISEIREGNILLFYLKLAFISICGSSIVSTCFAVILYKKQIAPYIATLRRFTPLLKLMVNRDYKVQYKRSFLGVLWSLINPLMTMLIMTMVFSLLFQRNIPNFPAYLLSGSLIFSFFSEATRSSMLSIVSNRSVINKVYVPKYIFPLSKVFLSIVNLGLSLAAFAVVFIITKVPFHWTVILIPIPLLYTFVFIVGVSMFLSCVAVFFNDIQYLYGILLTALNYFTPIFYPVSILPPRVLQFMGLNPMYHFVTYFRSLTLDGVVPGLWANVVCISFALFFLFFGTLVFMANQDKFILYI